MWLDCNKNPRGIFNLMLQFSYEGQKVLSTEIWGNN